MKTTVLCSAVVLGVLPLAASAEEVRSTFSWGDIIVQPRAYVGYADYSLEGSDITITSDTGNTRPGKLLFGLPDRNKVDIEGFVGGIGATVATGKFFGDIYYQGIPSETVYSGVQRSSSEGIENYGDIDAKHYDWAISLGYRITDQWSVFAGYKAGQTDSDQSGTLNSPTPESELLQTLNYSVTFDQGGPFLGTSYSFSIGPGVLTLKAAYAYLDGKYTSDFQSTYFPPVTPAPVPALQQFTWEGNSNAYSLGVSWTQSIAENLGFSLGANYHRYEFDASGSQRFTATIGGEPFPPASGVLEGGNLTEGLFTLTASLFYQF
ncbi:MAG: hypothetical protein LM523_08010 [Candidatus Contendobacter sp.]|nr:hypothetical protein [Candidatus Contendobacter sp.]